MLSLMTGLAPIDYEVHTISTDVSTLALHFPVKIFHTSSTLLRFLFLLFVNNLVLWTRI